MWSLRGTIKPLSHGGGDLNGTEVIKILVIHMVQVKDLFPIHVFILFWSIDITELNDLRKTICLRKSEVCVEKKFSL